ncbi:hypothetical protein [Rhodococcus sovatensis]|uniref:Uncharacterized protein n=1 Tax=Rhodococcus sovatensis TaxID=1805840 RepID=A0ABZ2PM52_9NOCA
MRFDSWEGLVNDALLIHTAIHLKPVVEDTEALRPARRIAVLEGARTVDAI